jgi:hypothetical protein
MKNYLRNSFFALIMASWALGCSPQNQEGQVTSPGPETSYGDPISAEGAVPASQLPRLLAGQDSVEVKLVGTVLESCRNKGCWMKVAVEGEKPMQVTFKDYGFFVPKNMEGETAIMEGLAYVDTVSVADLRHFAEDAGKSAAEIAAITSPEPTLTFVAQGVIIQK